MMRITMKMNWTVIELHHHHLTVHLLLLGFLVMFRLLRELLSGWVLILIANPEHSSSTTPSKMSNKQTQPRSPANPPPAPSLEFQSAGTTRGSMSNSSDQVNSTNLSQSNLQQNITSVTSPPKATSWLERAVQLVKGVKSQKNTSQQRDNRHEGDQGNRVSLGPIIAQERQEFQLPLRPLRLQSLSRNYISENMVTPQNDSVDTLPGPQIPLRDPFGQDIISRAGPAKMNAPQAVAKNAKEQEFPPSVSVSGLQRPRVHVSDTYLVHGSVSNNESVCSSSKAIFPRPQSLHRTFLSQPLKYVLLLCLQKPRQLQLKLLLLNL
jgi:hypothetical protein